MMRHFAILAGLAALAACSGGPSPYGPSARGYIGRPLANPSAVVAAELAFNRLAQDKGQWTAFRETATDDAVMFVPDQVNAQSWLKDRADPAQSVKWQPAQIYMACDGRTAVSTGPWQRPDGSQGYFTTVWVQEKPDKWKWVLDHADSLATPRPAMESIQTKVATCRASERPEGKKRMGFGDLPPDDTLKYTWDVRPDKSRTLVVQLWDGTGYAEVLRDEIAAPVP